MNNQKGLNELKAS